MFWIFLFQIASYLYLFTSIWAYKKSMWISTRDPPPPLWIYMDIWRTPPPPLVIHMVYGCSLSCNIHNLNNSCGLKNNIYNDSDYYLLIYLYTYKLHQVLLMKAEWKLFNVYVLWLSHSHRYWKWVCRLHPVASKYVGVAASFQK